MGAYRAVKIVHRSSFDSDRPYTREFEGLRRFEPVSRSHESQVDVLHVGRGEGYFYYVMELADDAKPKDGEQSAVTSPDLTVQGHRAGDGDRGSLDPETYVPKTLKSELVRRGRLPIEECIQIGLGLTTALEHLHKHGLSHRDIKPANIIFVNGLPKLADIGLVAAVDATCSFLGTEGYLAPEGAGAAQADLYSLGKVLYEISTGKDRFDFPELPVALDSPDETRGMMELNAVVIKACKPDLKDRYQSASEMRRDLMLLLAGRSVRQTHELERRLAIAKRFAVAMAAVMLFGVVPYYVAIRQARAARRAEAETKEQLYASYLAQAQAGRFSHRAGRRFQGLEQVRKAAQFRSSVEVRKEAIACMALRDIRLVREFGVPTMTAADFDFVGRRLAHRAADGDIIIDSLDEDRELARLPGDGAAPEDELDFSRSGSLLAAFNGTPNGHPGKNRLVVWSVDRRERVLSLTNDLVRTPDFSADDRIVVLYGRTDGIMVYELTTGKKLAVIPVASLPASFRLHPDGRRLAVSFTGKEEVQLFDWPSGKIRRELTAPSKIWNLAWHPDGRHLAAATLGGESVIWDLASNESTVIKAHRLGCTGIAFNSEGNLLATAGWDHRLRLYDLFSQSEVCNLPTSRYLVSFSPDGRWIGGGSSYDKIGLYEVASGPFSSLYLGDKQGAWTTDCAFSPDGHLVTSHPDGLRLWDLVGRRQITFHPAQREVRSIRFLRARTSVVTSDTEGIKEWPVLSGALPLAVTETSQDSGPQAILAAEPRALSFGEPRTLSELTGIWWDIDCNDNILALASPKMVQVIDPQTAQPIWQLRDLLDPRFTALSPDGKWCAAGTWATNALWVFQAKTGSMQKILAGCFANSRAAFSPNSRWLAVGDPTEYRFFRTGSWTLTATIRREAAGNAHAFIAFNPDSRMAALALSAQTVRLVESETGRELATLEAPEPQNISSLAFSPDGAQLVVATDGPIIQLWDLRQIRKELATMNLDWELSPMGNR
jgi:WD40 repeat protein